MDEPTIDDLHAHQHSLVDMFEELSFLEKWRRVLKGLKAPRNSGEAKWARLQLLRLSAPLAAILVPGILIVCMMFLGAMGPPPPPPVEVQIVEVEELPELDEIDEEILDQDIEPPEPIDMEFTPDIAMQTDVPIPTPVTDMSPQVSEISAVAIVKSPIIMRGIIGNRSAGMRGSALAEFGGNKETESAVLNALRWLQKTQEANGAWPNNRVAMTALALLTFLAHGETPASEEFGPTVLKAIQYLVSASNQGGHFGGNYEIPIATYAVCEAYALTKVPALKEVAEKNIEYIINGQHESGGWDYSCKQSERDDTSYMGWCAQALKAAKMAGLKHPKLEEAMHLAVKGFQKNAHPEGGFGYCNPGQGGLTGVGVLCMQLLGAANEPEARKGLAWIEQNITMDWEQPYGASPIYYWYYITQAKFHHGGSVWKKWNREFTDMLTMNQTVEEGAGLDGKDIGYWDTPSDHEHHDGRVMDTCLCALQLEVYYRYLPTYKPPEVAREEKSTAGEKDIEIDIRI
jgi:prenyltransferase beta subunit